MATVGRHPALLGRDGTGLIVVDVQEAFRQAIDGFDAMARNVGILAAGFGVLGRPVLVSEQYPSGLGQTVSEVAERLPEGTEPVAKTRFSACGVAAFDEQLTAAECSRWVVCGIETHVCVSQTVHDLLEKGLEVHVPADAVGSRHRVDYERGLERMERAGAVVTTVEAALFELLERAGTPEFKAVQQLIL